MFIRDLGEILDRQTTADGFVRVKARFARTGVQQYLASELGLSDRNPGEKVGIYRPADEVFAKASLDTFAGVPVTNNHPPVMLDTKNTKHYMVGFSGDTLSQEDGYMVGYITLTDAKAIEDFAAGKKELSNGYRSDIDWKAGVTTDGVEYAGVQRNIRGNHIAMVDAGRCGPACRIIDEKALTDCNCGDKPMADVQVVVDSISYTMNDQTAAVVTKLITERNTARGDLTTAQNTIVARDTTIVQLTADVAAAKAALPTGEALDAMAVERASVLDKAGKILGADVKLAGVSTADAKKQAVAKVMGDAAKDYTPAMIDAAFAALVVQAGVVDGVRKAIVENGGTKVVDPNADPREAAYDKYMDRLQNGWQTAGNKGNA